MSGIGYRLGDAYFVGVWKLEFGNFFFLHETIIFITCEVTFPMKMSRILPEQFLLLFTLRAKVALVRFRVKDS